MLITAAHVAFLLITDSHHGAMASTTVYVASPLGAIGASGMTGTCPSFSVEGAVTTEIGSKGSIPIGAEKRSAFLF